MDVLNNMRDPAGNADAYNHWLTEEVNKQRRWRAALPTDAVPAQVNTTLSLVIDYQNYVVYQYGAGVPLATIQAELFAALPGLVDDLDFVHTHSGEAELEWKRTLWRRVGTLNGANEMAYGFSAIALLLGASGDTLRAFSRLLHPADIDQAGYLLHLLLKAFIPDYPGPAGYKPYKGAAPWTEPVIRALALPPEERAAALAAHMKNWKRVMRPYGLKPDLDTRPGHDKLFCYFAFEVALAVCAYDIDDSAFAGHPYYPRDLVDYYRKHVRATRDAWRAEHVGGGIPVVALPPPRKADLAASKRKGVARWIELVCDGEVGAAGSALEELGNPRTIKSVDRLLEALAGQVIHVDFKDDDTLAVQAAGIAWSRALGEFEAPAGPPFGLARCLATLLAFAPWLEARGYRLVDISEDDTLRAVAVKAGFHAEFLALSGELGLYTREPDDVYRNDY